ncbi:hypothetical protein ACJMK2_040265 [Sinanodonta woodiana]|uniref:Coactosin-like protein n=1 Tax=Sinanodonta woodiana TaxID=1069815 RepID=A0ABD3WEJ5_SINWO
MSTSAEFTDGTHFAESAKLVRDDSAAEKYVILGHVDGNPNHVAVQKVGYDVSELPNETDDSQVLYILARYESTFDMSSTVKFVYFRWIGDAVPYAKRGKYGVVHGSIQEHFNPYHLFIETSSREDFDPEKINQQLEETTGKKSKVLESSHGRQERGFTATQLPNRDHQVASVPPMAREGAKIEISTEVYTAIAAVRSNEDPTRIGSDVKPMTKAKISTHKGTIEEAFGQFHVTIFATDLSDISENVIMDKVKDCKSIVDLFDAGQQTNLILCPA